MVSLFVSNRSNMQTMKKVLLQFCLSVTLFVALLFCANQVKWMNIMGLRPNIIIEKETEVLWKVASFQFHEIDNESIVAPVDSILTRLCEANNINRERIKLHVCRTTDVNAFATVGGHMMVFTGLIRECRNEQELAGVIAHELAHVKLGHVKSGAQIQLALAALTVLVTQGNDGGLASTVSNLLSNAITRKSESQADMEGVRMMERADLEPENMANFLERMLSVGFLEFLSDHPDSEKRAAEIRKAIKGKKYHYRPILSEETWQKINY